MIDSGSLKTPVPLVTVLLPVLNGERWISECLESLRMQTFQDFEVLLIDDGCTDKTVALARKSGVKLRVIEGPRQGLGSALACGVIHAESPLLARQDVDDLSHPQRLELQVAYMNSHPNCVLLGTWASTLDENGLPIGTLEMPRSTRAIRFAMNTYCPFVHTSVLMRRKSVVKVGNYKSTPGRIFVEDYDLWTRLAELGDVHNLPQALVSYRIHTQSVTATEGAARISSGRMIADRSLQNTLGMELSESDRELSSLFFFRNRRVSIGEMLRLYRILFGSLLRSGFPPPEICKRWRNWFAPVTWIVRTPRYTNRVPEVGSN